MTVDVSWSATFEHIKATNLVNPALAQQEFGYFLAANSVVSVAAAELMGRDYGLDPSLARPSLTFAEQTNDFLAQLAHEAPQQKMWSFLNYLQQNSLQSDEANANVVETLGEKIGFDLDQRRQIVSDFIMQQKLSVSPYLQVDTMITIYGVPESGIVEAKSKDPKDRTISRKLSNGAWQINIFGANEGSLRISKTFDEFGKVGGDVTANWTVTTTGRTFATFKNQFGLGEKLPVGSYVDGFGDIHLIKGDELNWTKSAFKWALDNSKTYTNLTGVKSGNKQDIQDLVADFKYYYKRESEKRIDISYNSIEQAHIKHVQLKKTWSKFEVQEVFQSAMRLSTLLTNQISAKKLNFADQPNPDGRADEYTDSVTQILRKYNKKANAQSIGDALISAILSPAFNQLVKDAKGLARETIQNAYLVLSTFDPAGAAAALDVDLISRGLPNNSAFRPNAKKKDDPNTYVSYLMRRMLTETNLGPQPGKEAVKNTAISAATVYIFGIFRELVPAAKIFTLQKSIQEQAIRYALKLGTIQNDGRLVYIVPKYAGRTFSQDGLGAFEYAFARLEVGVNFRFNQFQRARFGTRTEFLGHTNAWMPVVSFVLRANQQAQGYQVLEEQDKHFITARMVADVMSLAGYLYEHRARLSAFATKLKVSATRLLAAIKPIGEAVARCTNFPHPVFAGFQCLNFDLSSADLKNNYYIRPFAKFLNLLGPIAGELVGEVADLVYGTVNIASGSIRIAKGQLLKGVGLLVYGVINFASGSAFTYFTVRGIATKEYHWSVPFRAVSFWLQVAASVANGYLATISVIEAEEA